MNKIKGLIKRLILEGVEDDYKKKLLNDNPYLGMNQINYYVNEFNKIKNNLPTDKRDITKYDWEDLEQIVDSNQSFEKIEKGVIEIDNSDVVYDDNNLKILKANTKQACVKYGTGYGFCISSRGSGNQYYNYRYGDEYSKNYRSIYFVIDEDKTKDIKTKSPIRFKDPTHMLVIMVKDNGYQVTTANNDGDKNMSWDDIVKIEPKLSGKEYLFKALEANKDEESIYMAKLSFKQYLNKWRDDNEEWLGKDNSDDLRLNFGDSTIDFYTNNIDTLEFNYKLLKKIKDLSINGKVQVIEFDDNKYSNYLTFLTPSFQYPIARNKYEYQIPISVRKVYQGVMPSYEKKKYSYVDSYAYFKYKALEYFSNLGLKNGFRVESNNPIIKKDGIFVAGYIKNENVFKPYLKEFGKFQDKLNIKRSWVTLDNDFYRYTNEIEKLYKLYMNHMNKAISTM
jgi:hypothetical protein